MITHLPPNKSQSVWEISARKTRAARLWPVIALLIAWTPGLRTAAAQEMNLPAPQGQGSGQSSSSGVAEIPPQSQSACRGVNDPLVTVPDRGNYKLLNPCVVVRGTINSLPLVVAGTNELYFNFSPDKEYTARNTRFGIVVPSDQVDCRPGKLPEDEGKCSGANLVIPKQGTHVEITGAYVVVTSGTGVAGSGVYAICPVWAIKELTR